MQDDGRLHLGQKGERKIDQGIKVIRKKVGISQDMVLFICVLDLIEGHEKHKVEFIKKGLRFLRYKH